MSMSGPETGSRILPADDLPGSIRQALSDLSKVSEALDSGIQPSMTMSVTIATLAQELVQAAAAARAAAAAEDLGGPGDDDTWSADARTLMAEYGDLWSIARSTDNPLILVCELTQGSSTRVIAGRPGDCLTRIRAIPAREPTIVRADAGAWISGPGYGPGDLPGVIA